MLATNIRLYIFFIWSFSRDSNATLQMLPWRLTRVHLLPSTSFFLSVSRSVRENTGQPPTAESTYMPCDLKVQPIFQYLVYQCNVSLTSFYKQISLNLEYTAFIKQTGLQPRLWCLELHVQM